MTRSTCYRFALGAGFALSALLSPSLRAQQDATTPPLQPAAAQPVPEARPLAPEATSDAGILARVNGRAILAMSVDNVALQLEADGTTADRARILDELIDMELLTQAAEALELQQRPAIASALQLQYTQTLANAFLAEEGNRVEITDSMLRAEYELQTASLAAEEYRGSHIVLETEEEAREVILALAGGAEFATLADNKSIDSGPAGSGGGDLGWFRPDAMVDVMAAAFAALEPGATSTQPVQSEFGYHVLKLNAVRAASHPDFEAVKPVLTDIVLRKRLAARVESLRRDATIERVGDSGR